MKLDRTAPTAWIVTAVTGGILFLLGGITTTMATSPRLVMAGGALAFVIMGVYTAAVVRRRNTLIIEQTALLDTIDEMRTADTSLRTRMAYTLRDPLTSIVGFSDHMVNSPDLAFDEQREMLVAIRADALEVERALSDLAEIGQTPTDGSPLQGVVLLDEEMRSIASTIITDATFESDFAQTRAWGDSAKVRQILRTALNAATDSGCAHITLHSVERAGRATASISARDDLLNIEAIAALTGNTISEDLGSDAYRALRSAYELAASMGGSIGYAQAFGISHIVIDLPMARRDFGITTPNPKPEQTFELSFATTTELRPERPTSAIRFA
jgi:signal transduction histidine kinase